MRSKALICVAVATIALFCLACGGCRKSDSAAGPAPGPNTAQPQPAPPTAPAQPPQHPPEAAIAEPVALGAEGGVIRIGPFAAKFVDDCYSWSYSDALQVAGNLVSLTERRAIPLPVADGVVGSRDGKRAAFFDSGYLRIRDLQSGEESSWPLGQLRGWPSLSFCPSGRYLFAYVGLDEDRLATYTVFGIDLETGQQIPLSTEEVHPVWEPVWSPDGTQVVVREYYHYASEFGDGQYLLFDLAAGRCRPLHDVLDEWWPLEVQHSIRWVDGQPEITDLPRPAEGPNGELAFGYDPVRKLDEETAWEDCERATTLRIRSGQSVFDLDLLPALAEAGLEVPPPDGDLLTSLHLFPTWIRATNRILVFVECQSTIAYVVIDPTRWEPRCRAAGAGLRFTRGSHFYDEISPDGTQAVVVRAASRFGRRGAAAALPEDAGVYLLNLITAEERPVFQGEALEAWFLDDGRLVVITPTEAAVTSAGGEDWSVLMAAPAGDLYTTSDSPSELSPDGRYLALARSHELDDGWDRITVDVVDLSQ